VKAKSFPDGIIAAHEALSLVTKNTTSNHFGISYPHDGEILYMAGEEIEAEQNIPPGTERFTIRRGNYASFYIKNFMENLPLIEKAFGILTDDPRIDPNGCCVECYLPEGSNFKTAKDMRCMVRLTD
jgi:predicted transcriptional regulator YdeE